MFRRVLLLTIAAIVFPLSVFAHEGHGVLHGHEPGHYLFSAEHAVPLLLAAVIVLAFIGRKAWLAQRK